VVFQQDVRSSGETVHQVGAGETGKIDRDRPFAPIHGLKERTRLLPLAESVGRYPRPGVVARCGPLDLHDVTPDVGEDLGRQGPRDNTRKIKSPDTPEWPHGSYLYP
jgi:hypothetical protein